MAEYLNAEQSKRRIAMLQAQGYEVSTEVQPNGDVVVYKRKPTDGMWWLLALGIGALVCLKK